MYLHNRSSRLRSWASTATPACKLKPRTLAHGSPTLDGVDPELNQQWLKVDGAFERNIVKRSVDERVRRYNHEPVIDIPAPPGNHRFQK